MAERMLIIGLDGATWDVLEPMIADGDLPNIERLRREGSWGPLRSTIPPLSAPAWATFMTGKNPAHHGIFHFERSNTDGGIVNGAHIESATLWDVLAHQGRRVGVINMPMTYPPRPVNGFVVTGLLTPPDEKVFTHPAELSERLDGYQIDLDRFIADKPFAQDETGVKPKREVKPDLQLMDEFHQMEMQRCAVALELMESEDWDVFSVVVTATDRMGHYLWPYHLEAETPDDAESQALHQAVRAFYRDIDAAIGRMVDAAGPGTATFIASDHGMGAIYSKNTHWNNWLYKRGYLDIDKSSRRTPDGLMLKLGISRDRLRKWASKVPGLTGSKAFKSVKSASTATVDDASTKVAYERIFDPVGGFRINATGAERDRIRDELLEALPTVVDPGTGEPIVEEVGTRDQYFTGPHADEAPDVIIVMKPDYGSSSRLGNYSAVVTDRPTITDPGSHRMDGMFIMCGDGVPARVEPVTGMELQDVAPTVLHALSLGVPTDMDGVVRTELFAGNGHSAAPETIDPPGRWPSEEAAADALAEHASNSDGDEEAVRDRLRALGYFA